MGDTKISSLALTIFGGVHVIVSLSGGKLARYMKGNLLMILSASGMFIGVIIASAATAKTWYLYLVAGGFLGTMEAGLLTQIFIMFGQDFDADKLLAVNSSTLPNLIGNF